VQSDGILIIKSVAPPYKSESDAPTSYLVNHLILIPTYSGIRKNVVLPFLTFFRYYSGYIALVILDYPS